jgi:polyisoprenoid-binding protein YceI
VEPVESGAHTGDAQPSLTGPRQNSSQLEHPGPVLFPDDSSRRQVMPTTLQSSIGLYELDRAHSTVQFAVRHLNVSTFRASFTDIDARLTIERESIALDARAQVDSVSIVEPPEFRDHVVRGDDFFAADDFPLITFHSTSVVLEDDGRATVSGELAIRDITRSVTASGRVDPPTEDPFGTWHAGVELRATIDRRDWELNWQMPLPDGRDALGWDVEITAHLELIKAG